MITMEFHNVPWLPWNFPELLPLIEVKSMQKVKGQGHKRSKQILPQFGYLQAIAPVWLHRWLRNDAQSMNGFRKVTVFLFHSNLFTFLEKVPFFFFVVTCSLPRWLGPKNNDFDPNCAFLLPIMHKASRCLVTVGQRRWRTAVSHLPTWRPPKQTNKARPSLVFYNHHTLTQVYTQIDMVMRNSVPENRDLQSLNFVIRTHYIFGGRWRTLFQNNAWGGGLCLWGGGLAGR